MTNFFDCKFYEDIQKPSLAEIKAGFDRWLEESKQRRNFDGKDERLMLLGDVIRNLDADWQKELGTHKDGRQLYLTDQKKHHNTSKKRRRYILGVAYNQDEPLKIKESYIEQQRKGSIASFMKDAKAISIAGFSFDSPGIALVNFDGELHMFTESDIGNIFEKV